MLNEGSFKVDCPATLYPISSLGEKNLLRSQVTTDSDTVFREESIGEGFKIVIVAVFEKILLFEKKNWFIFDRNF